MPMSLFTNTSRNTQAVTARAKRAAGCDPKKLAAGTPTLDRSTLR